ncbi:conserved exported hypothetical protein [Bradyrhizobium oligotrophicum S58]|uniref:Uncharacterized protein n=1 Tax=Bradyrhizobium oligotrophicum S58 TaxID=1245469 RepID=M4ZZY0_9BRAD|nr:hypothetical protein [Bradyrhizobium oligotrophicum]BAM92070.1 conserved exported hypothetical protein [Bradyrhizobium oligotrophicum S58]
MIALRSLPAALLMSTLAATAAPAQFSEPAAYEAMHPERDVLNGGALTPAAQAELARRGASAFPNANAAMPPADPERPHRRHRR